MSTTLERPPGPPKDPPSYDLECLSPEDLLSRTILWHKKKTLSELAELEHIAEIDRRELYLSFGFTSTAEWVANTFGDGYMRSLERVDVAVSLARLPELKEAFRKGRLSYDQLRALVLVADEENVEELISQSQGRSVAQVHRLVRKRIEITTEESKDRKNNNWLEKRWDKDGGSLYFWGQLAEDDGAKFERAIDYIAKDIGDKNTPMGRKRAEALVALSEGRIPEHSSRDQVVIHVKAESLDTGKGVAEIQGGPTVSIETAKAMCCDSVIQLLIEDADGTPIAVTKARRGISNGLERAVYELDGGKCAVFSCRITKNLKVHHVKDWIKGGPTEVKNLLLLCRDHHDKVHYRGYVIKGSRPRIWLEKEGRPTTKPGPPRISEQTIAAFDLEFAIEIEEMGRDP